MEKVNEILMNVLSIDASEIDNDLSMEQVAKWDSLKHMELIGSLEDTFDFQFTMDEIAEMRTTGKVKTVVHNRIS